MPDAHPLCLGSALSFAPVDDLLREADATLLVGAELSSLELWGLDRPLELRGLVRVDIDAGQLDRRWPAEVALHGDARATLTALVGGTRADAETAVDRAARGATVASRVARARAALSPPPEIARFTPLLEAIDRALPADRIIAGDSTQPVYAANHLLAMHGPRSWLMPIGYGCLGCALPMAIGAKLALPERAGAWRLPATAASCSASRSSRPPRAAVAAADPRLRQQRLRGDPGRDVARGDRPPRNRRDGP